MLILIFSDLSELEQRIFDIFSNFASKVTVNPRNWSDSNSFLVTVSQTNMDNLSTLVSDVSVSGSHNHTVVTVGTVLDVTYSTRNNYGNSSNATGLFEKNTRSQQDQCWETYVGQVPSSS